MIRNITEATQRLELTVNTSRILTLDKRVPKMVVNNPELVSVTPISANQVQIAAKKPGVTQINLWDEEDQVYTVDLTIYGDVRELQDALKRLFPESSVNVLRLTNSLVLEGFVERPEAVSPIVRLAEDYAPKIVNNITVGGVQQVLLKVKVMEVSRTKLRRLAMDWSVHDGTNFVASNVSQLISAVTGTGPPTTVGGTYQAFVGGGDFFSILDALQQNNVAKILADPTITAVSGRPAHFNVGGELPVLVPSGLVKRRSSTREFGTQVDFVPIVLGNGNIRLEVRPRVSEIDDTRSVSVNGFTVPALKVRQVDTGVEMKAGQTLALAGLVQTRIEAQERGLPFVSDLPLIGTAFRSVEEEVNEIELLILVTPEFAAGMDPHEVPQCGPGMESVSPTNCQLYFGGHLEVPSCGPCGPCGPNGFGDCGAGACSTGECGANCSPGGAAYISDGVPTAAPVEMQSVPMTVEPMSYPSTSEPIQAPAPTMDLPPDALPVTPQNGPSLGPDTSLEPTAGRSQSIYQARVPTTTPTPQQLRIPDPMPTTRRWGGTNTPGLMGPIGYDVE